MQDKIDIKKTHLQISQNFYEDSGYYDVSGDYDADDEAEI